MGQKRTHHPGPAKRKGAPHPQRHQHAQCHSELCPAFGTCGGCTALDVPYAEQLARKQVALKELFQDVAPADAFLDPLGMEEPYGYRSKVISPFVRSKARGAPQDRILTGMYALGTHRVIPVERCVVEHPLGQRVVRAIRQIMARHGMEPYDEDTSTGFMRHVVIRLGHESGEVLVTLVTNGREFPHARSFCKELRAKVPEITSIVQNVNLRQTNVILGEEEKTLYGPGFILDTLCGLSFRISSRSFYQTNATMTSILYTTAIGLAEVRGKAVIDAYCGTGTLGLVCAKAGAARVIGVDNVRDAIADARLNAKHNAIENAEFYTEDATTFMEASAARRDFADDELVILLDPPRAGSTPEFVRAACSLEPKRIIYISCNPKTQRRDVDEFRACGYGIEAIVAVDMFPHTNHMESIVALGPLGPNVASSAPEHSVRKEDQRA